MKPSFLSPLYLFILSLLIAGCSAGKRSLEKGNYDQAVYQAINRLQKDTDNRKALTTLMEAYRYASGDHLDNIREAKLSSDVLRWETVIREYEALNALIDGIKRCPSCRQTIPLPEKYTSEIAEARLNAAAVRYARGLKLLEDKNRLSAKQSYYDFEKADQLSPGFKDVYQKMDEAYWLAVIKVVVEMYNWAAALTSSATNTFRTRSLNTLKITNSAVSLNSTPLKRPAERI